MENVNRNLVGQYATVFAGNGSEKTGFSAKEIISFFEKYSTHVKCIEDYEQKPNRQDLFIESLYCLDVKQQYYALNDLTQKDIESKYDYPDEEKRVELREKLCALILPDPIGMCISDISENEFRKDWLDCINNIEENPRTAITAARTLLETIFKTIIQERGGEPDTSGSLSRLLKQAEKVVSFDNKKKQSTHQIITGFASIIEGLACLSNSYGDRHGIVENQRIDDPDLALLAANAAATVGITFIKFHLFNNINS